MFPRIINRKKLFAQDLTLQITGLDSNKPKKYNANIIIG
jgi:hypothetical protein